MDLLDHLAALGPTRLDVDAHRTLHWALTFLRGAHAASQSLLQP